MPPSTVKAEVAALSSIVDALDPLPQASRSRVLETAAAWLSNSGASESATESKQKKPRAKRQQFGMRKQAKKSKSSDAPRGDRLSDRIHTWLTEQSKPQDLLAIADACRTSRGSVYQTIRKDDRFVQVARGEWGVK